MDDRNRHPAGRARHPIALGMLLLGAVVLGAGCTTAGDDDGPSPTSAVSATGSGPADKMTVTIPTSAFFELPPGLRKPPRGTPPVAEALPRLCGDEFDIDGLGVTASAAMTSAYKQSGDPPGNVPRGTITQTILTFRDGGAQDYLRRLRESLAACPSFLRAGATVVVQTQPLPGVGDDALLVTQRWPQTDLLGNRTGGDAVSQVAVIRVDQVATVLYNQGWEGASSRPDLMDGFTRSALWAIDLWQR